MAPHKILSKFVFKNFPLSFWVLNFHSQVLVLILILNFLINLWRWLSNSKWCDHVQECIEPTDRSISSTLRVLCGVTLNETSWIFPLQSVFLIERLNMNNHANIIHQHFFLTQNMWKKWVLKKVNYCKHRIKYYSKITFTITFGYLRKKCKAKDLFWRCIHTYFITLGQNEHRSYWNSLPGCRQVKLYLTVPLSKECLKDFRKNKLRLLVGAITGHFPCNKHLTKTRKLFDWAKK